MRSRAVTAVVALGLAASGLGVAFASPALALTTGPGAPSTWVFTDSAGPAPVDPAGDTPVGSFLDDGVKHTHRAYFTYDLGGLRGQALHQATLSAAETSVRDCTTAAPVEVWRTGPISRETTWSTPPAELELVHAADFGPAAAVCPGAYLGIDVLAQVQAALDRHDPAITFEVRIGAGAEGKILAGRMMRQFRLTVAANHVPVVSAPTCGTPTDPVAAGGRTTLALHVTDADGDRVAGSTRAVWPVEHPDQRKQFHGSVADLHGYPDGTILAWSGQARDADDASAWSDPCYLTVDNTAPRTAPVVSSATCSDGQNVPGTFYFDAAGDRDTVAFGWYDDRSGRSGRAEARRPGGRVRLNLAPDLPGDDSLQVSAIDAAGNRGPAVEYDFCPRDLPVPSQVPASDAPGVTSASFAWDHDAVLGQPGSFTFTPHGSDVVAYLYDLGTGGRQRVAAEADGTATLNWTPPRSGDFALNVSSVSADGAISESARSTFYVIDTRPSIWATTEPTGVSRPAHLTVSSDLPGVRQYLYRVDGGPERSIPYAFQAALAITPTHAGPTVVTVRSRLADGTLTPSSSVTLPVSSAPVIEPVRVLGSPAIAERIGSVKLSPGAPDVASYRYTFDGRSQTVAAGPDGSATVQFAPDQAGWRTLTAESVSRDGTVSDTRRYPVVVDDPRVQVTASWPATGAALGLGVPGTFRLLGDLAAQTSEYLWHVDGGPVQIAPRDPATAYTQIAFTPDHVGPSTFSVQRRFSDGSLSPVTDYHFQVGTLPRVTSDADGRVTTLTFSGGRPGVVSFDYQVVGASDGAVDAAGTVLTDESGAAQAAFTPPSNDSYRVIVTGHTATGNPTGTTTYALP